MNEMETQSGLLEPILEENYDNVCYLYQCMLHVMFFSLEE